MIDKGQVTLREHDAQRVRFRKPKQLPLEISQEARFPRCKRSEECEVTDEHVDFTSEWGISVRLLGSWSA